jgi:hypothetical protein
VYNSEFCMPNYGNFVKRRNFNSQIYFSFSGSSNGRIVGFLNYNFKVCGTKTGMNARVPMRAYEYNFKQKTVCFFAVQYSTAKYEI